MKTIKKRVITCFLLLMLVAIFCALPAYAAESTTTQNGTSQTESAQVAAETTKGTRASAAGLAIGLAAAGGAIAMGIAVAKSSDAISRQPEAESKIRNTLMLGLVFIETAIIYALIVVILIIFVM